jgi:hypothetical protein
MMASGTRVAVRKNIIIDGFNQKAVTNRVERLRQHLNNLGAQQDIDKIGDFAFPFFKKRKAPLTDVESTLAATPTKVAQRESPMNREVRLENNINNNSAYSFSSSKRSLHRRAQVAQTQSNA